MYYTFNASQVHFQAALDKARLARERRHDSENERQQGLTGMEPRARETDAAIAAVMLTQAAAESYANWVHIQAGTHPGFLRWRQAWERFPAAAAELGRPADFKLGADREATLVRLGAWRNFLMHSDPNARDRLRKSLADRGEIASDAGERAMVDLLNANLAEWAVTALEEIFRWAEAQTGISAPFTNGAWLGEGFR